MPPIPNFLGGDGGILWVLLALVLIGGILWRPARAVARAIKSLSQLMEDWHGTPDRVDRTGAVIEPGRPGVPALLETVRSQVQNSHETNFRDDLDQVKIGIDRLTRDVQAHKEKLDEHIVIAKTNDRLTADTAEKVDRLARRWADDEPNDDH
ncbi:MAG: DUF2746 domain-containing protein [Galactobacter sp.]